MNSLSLCKCITLVCGRWEDVSNKVTGSVERFDLKWCQWSQGRVLVSGRGSGVKEKRSAANETYDCMCSVAVMLIISCYHAHRPMTLYQASGSPWWPPPRYVTLVLLSAWGLSYIWWEALGGPVSGMLRLRRGGRSLVHGNAPAVVWQGRVLVSGRGHH